MKKITLLFILFLFANLNFSQNLTPAATLQKADNQKHRLNSRADVYIIDSTYCSQFDDDVQDFVPTARSYNLEFDLETGLVLESLDQSYDKNLMQWNNTFYTTRTYNEDDELVLQIVENWDADNEVWVNSQRIEIFFNAMGQVEKNLTQVWVNDNWQNTNQTIFQYDNDGDNDQFETQIWDVDNEVWVNQNVIFQAFNGNNQLTATLVRIWDTDLGEYVNANQSFFTYNGDLKTETLVKSWNPAEEDFINANRELFSHDGNGNQTERIAENWNLAEELWIKTQRVTNEYSPEGFDILKTTQNWANDQWNNQFQETKEYDAGGNIQNFKFYLWQNDDWVFLSQCEFFGKVLIEDNVEKIESLIDCSFQNPMPKGGIFDCDLEGFEDLEMVVYDLNGRELFRKNMDNQASFQLDWDFQKGFYFFTLQNSSNVLLSEKLIVF